MSEGWDEASRSQRTLSSGTKWSATLASLSAEQTLQSESTAASRTTVSSTMATDSSTGRRQGAWAAPPTSGTKSPSSSAIA